MRLGCAAQSGAGCGDVAAGWPCFLASCLPAPETEPLSTPGVRTLHSGMSSVVSVAWTTGAALCGGQRTAAEASRQFCPFGPVLAGLSGPAAEKPGAAAGTAAAGAARSWQAPGRREPGGGCRPLLRRDLGQAAIHGVRLEVAKAQRRQRADAWRSCSSTTVLPQLLRNGMGC